MPDDQISQSHPSLVQAGLSSEQASVYQIMIQNGPLPASKIAQKALISRTLGYKVLDELIELGLVEKHDEPGKVALFIGAHPLKLREVADKRLEAARGAKAALDGVCTNLISEFNTQSGSPGIRILEGVGGVAELYEDILNEKQPMLLMRSPLDETRPELAELVTKQLKEQVKLGIRVRALTPLKPETAETYTKKDAERLVERRIIKEDQFNIPSQIIIYANKVAITAYEGELITTVIENPAIKKTFEIIFEHLWNTSTSEHEKIVQTLTSKPAEGTA